MVKKHLKSLSYWLTGKRKLFPRCRRSEITLLLIVNFILYILLWKMLFESLSLLEIY